MDIACICNKSEKQNYNIQLFPLLSPKSFSLHMQNNTRKCFIHYLD